MSLERDQKLSMNTALEVTKLGRLHLKVWFLSAMGVFLDGFDLFIIGVALLLIAREFSPTPFMTGMIGAAAVLGLLIMVVFWVSTTGRSLEDINPGDVVEKNR